MKTKKVYYVVDLDQSLIFGQFHKRSSAVEVRRILRPISDMFLEMGSNVLILDSTMDVKLAYYVTNFAKGRESHLNIAKMRSQGPRRTFAGPPKRRLGRGFRNPALKGA